MMLLEMTTGKAPLYRPPEFAPGYPPKLAAILLQAAARRRTHRHQSATELLGQLETFAKRGGVRTSPAAFAAFLRGLFPDAEAQLVRERREARLMGGRDDVRDEALTIPDTAAPPPSPTGFEVLPPVSAELESDLQSAGLHAITSMSPATRTWRPPDSNRWAVVATAFATGVLIGIFVGALGRDASTQSVAVTTSAPVHPSNMSSPSAPSPVIPSAPVADAQELGSLEVVSDPSSANVFVEGELMAEVTPTTLRKLPLGRPLHVKVSRAGFEPYQADVTLISQRPHDRIAAHLSPATFTLHLAIDAPDSAVWVDGRYTSARTLLGLAVDQDHKVAVSAPGRIGKIVMFRSEQSGEKHLDLKLDPVRSR
jgi:hypothetical protein